MCVAEVDLSFEDAMSVSLLTCVSNTESGLGPGHSCIGIYDKVYSFENWRGYFNRTSSGWVTFRLSEYLANNAHRPIITQSLISDVKPKKAREYIRASDLSDDDYASAGVCSSQAASTIQFAWGHEFDVSGIDTPYSVYLLAKRLNIVEKEEFFWSGKSSVDPGIQKRLEGLLSDIKRRPPPATSSEAIQALASSPALKL